MAATADSFKIPGRLLENEQNNFCQILNLFESKLYMNNLWMAPYNFFNFLCRLEIQDGHQRTLRFLKGYSRKKCLLGAECHRYKIVLVGGKTAFEICWLGCEQRKGMYWGGGGYSDFLDEYTVPSSRGSRIFVFLSAGLYL